MRGTYSDKVRGQPEQDKVNITDKEFQYSPGFVPALSLTTTQSLDAIDYTDGSPKVLVNFGT